MRKLITLLASLALGTSAFAQSTTLTINSSTGAVNVPAGLTPSFGTIHVGNTTITAPGGGAPNALRIVSAVDGDTGVLDIQNTHTSNAFSAINYLSAAGQYRLSMGYGNTTFQPYQNCAFIEANNLVGANAVPPDFLLAQTGTDGGGGYNVNVRMIMSGSSGLFQILGRIPGTNFAPAALSVSPSGRVRFGPPIGGVGGNMDFSGFGQTQIVQENGTATVLSMTENGVATGYLGFAANSGSFIIGSDSNSISFRGSPGGDLSGGSAYADINASRAVFHVTLNLATATPASSSAAGTAGDIAWDGSYIYICVGVNTWKRAAIATW